MSDLISRQVAIEVIDAAFPVDPMKSEYTQGLACGVALAKTYVEQLPSAQPEQRWILCSEGTPKKTSYYICTCHDGVCYRTSVLKWSTGWVLTGARSYWKVIAWMPLPEPYKGEERQ